MVDKSESIRISGLKELRKELAKFTDATFTKELKDAHYEVASKVVDKAKGAASTRVEQKAAQSLKASRAASKAQITYGGPEYPFAMGAEFGSKRYRQFKNHLGRTGYFVYPSVRAMSSEIARIYWDAVAKITHDAFPD